jgi:DNA-binding CsgD family transcriptional regulator
MSTRRPTVFLDRAAERELLDRMLHNVRGGQSAVIVLRGEAGVGKTALLGHCVGQASAFRVARVAGVEAEIELPFAAVHQLCTPMLAQLGALPEPQRDALSVALGLSSGEPRDHFLVALAVLSLLSAVAEERPLLCVVDDAHWLDHVSGQILGFVARRLLAESVALVFAVREPVGRRELDGLPELPLAGLGEEDARALLETVIPGRIDERVRDRIVAETHGNPLALLELPWGKTGPQLAGGFGVPASTDLPGRIERHYMERVSALPEATRRWLLLAAADQWGDASLLWRAAERLAIGAGDLAPAQELMEIASEARFRHPLVRSAAYRAASQEDRRSVHTALAEACDPDLEADFLAWHRALAAAGPDEDVAAGLECAAGRAKLRGGVAAAASFLERATVLTPDPGPRARRALAAAETAHLSGARQSALRLLAQAEAGPLDELERARVGLLRGRMAFGSSPGGAAPRLLLAAARELEPLDPVSARDTYLEAFSAALFAARCAGETGMLEVAQAVRAAPPHDGRPQDLLLDGLALVITEGCEVGAPLLKHAVGAIRTAQIPPEDAIHWLWLASRAAHDLWDDESWAALVERHVANARRAGALEKMPLALSTQVALRLLCGELSAAASLTDEVAAVTEAMGSELPPYGAVALAAFRGRKDEAASLLRTVGAEAARRGDGLALTLVDHAAALLYNGLGRYREACEAAQRGAANPHERGYASWALQHLVEAAVRTGRPALAEQAVERLAQSTSVCRTDWALGVEARARAVLSDDGAAEAFYRAAVEHLGRTRVRAELARAHLLYGEWLRRQGRRVDAREQLRSAHQMFTRMGMEAFADRTRRELAATGETVRKRQAETRDELTPQEEQIAQLARDGLTNAEIGGQLFLSPRTVEWHLKKVFGKLGISSRRGLVDALPSPTPDATPA